MFNLIFEVLCVKIKVDAFIIIMKKLKGSVLNIFDFFFIYIYLGRVVSWVINVLHPLLGAYSSFRSHCRYEIPGDSHVRK